MPGDFDFRNLTPEVREWLTGAQRRFRRACETLARLRRLALSTPALQFNIAASGGQQVNVTN